VIYFGTAKTAGDKYKTAYEEESKMSGVTINGKQYGSIEEYMEEISPTIVEGNIDDWDYETDDDDTLNIIKYKNQDTTIDTVVIPNYIDNKPVKRFGAAMTLKTNLPSVYLSTMWNTQICDGEFFSGETAGNNSIFFTTNSTIKKVIISKGIEEINTYALIGTTKMSEVIIPNSVVSIGKLAFGGCKTLNKITLPDSIKSIGESAFSSCTSLTDVTIPESVTTMGGWVFGYIPSITVHVPWKEGEKPEGWDDKWNKTDNGYTITVDYAK
jgi:hypothetical protein